MKEKFLIIDTYNFLHRAYHALPKTFRNLEGEPTNAVYGVTSMLINVFNQLKPHYAAAAMDSPEPTFRIEDFTGYKAQRKPMEEDLEVQIPKVAEILDAFGIERLTAPGYEADDLIATVINKLNNKADFIIVSNDKDLWQLAQKNVSIMVPVTNGKSEWIGPSEVKIRMGFNPDKIPDYKGLRGDPSDNIPGVYGVGEKTATILIKKFGSIEDIYKNIEKVEPDSLKNKLEENYEQALMSKKLAELIEDAPITFKLNDFKYSEFNRVEVKKVLEKYNFKSLIRRLGFEDGDSGRSLGSKKSKDPDEQLSLL